MSHRCTKPCSMSRRSFLRAASAGFAAAAWRGLAQASAARAITTSNEKPNFIVIFADDLGYGDLGCFGAENVRTPAIDRLAAEGMKLTSFYVVAPVCTPSRAALMTGCYPTRIGMAAGSRHAVLLAGDSKGLHPDEITIAEVLKAAGYSTGIFGKWHLGDQPEFLPTRQGFDEFFGMPYSWDIHPTHPNQEQFHFPPLPLLDGEKVIELDPDLDRVTERITERAVRFIEHNKDRPFFLYLPHFLPHRPLHISPLFMRSVGKDLEATIRQESAGVDSRTRDKLFPQAVSEIDWSVGQIMQTLRRLQLDRNTLILFTSDNGPGIGNAGPLRGGKGSTLEGGMREPTVAWWPGRIPSGSVCDELLTTMDLLPSFARLAGARMPSDRVIDGKDIWPVLSGQSGAKSPHEFFFYHGGNRLVAVRSGKWKLRVKGEEPVALFDLDQDIRETRSVLEQNPSVAERLLGYIRRFEKDLAANGRLAGFIDAPKPLSK